MKEKKEGRKREVTLLASNESDVILEAPRGPDRFKKGTLEQTGRHQKSARAVSDWTLAPITPAPFEAHS